MKNVAKTKKLDFKPVFRFIFFLFLFMLSKSLKFIVKQQFITKFSTVFLKNTFYKFIFNFDTTNKKILKKTDKQTNKHERQKDIQTKKALILLTQISTSDGNVFVSERSLYGLGQLARHRNGVHAAHMRVKMLPAGHPAVSRVHHRDETVEIGARALEHLVAVAFEAQYSVAVVAAFFVELIERLKFNQQKIS